MRGAEGRGNMKDGSKRLKRALVAASRLGPRVLLHLVPRLHCTLSSASRRQNMSPNVEYYCPCQASTPHPPQPNLASSSYSFHALHNLYFCEECDAIRCNHCVMVEVSGYYCPNCLFEVPSASVRAEKNRYVPAFAPGQSIPDHWESEVAHETASCARVARIR